MNWIKDLIWDLFYSHPKTVGMTYTEHMGHSLRIAFMLTQGAFKAVVHAIIPALFTDSSTKTCEQLQNVLSLTE